MSGRDTDQKSMQKVAGEHSRDFGRLVLSRPFQGAVQLSLTDVIGDYISGIRPR